MQTYNQSAESSQAHAAAPANDHFAKHGGVHFRNNASPQEINNFIRKLPAGKRESLFEVLDQLDKEGLITVMNDHVFTDGNGVIGGDNTAQH